MTTRRTFLKSAALASAAALAPLSAPAADSDAPNIVFLFSDDHSVPDLGCYGNRSIRTPNLDALAKAGMRFDRGYAACPQCSPSRASILTGRTPHAVGASRLHQNAFEDTPNIVQLLKAARYHTGALRKVHQGLIQKDFDTLPKGKNAFADFFDTRPKDKPFFLWFGSTDPHRDYEPGAVDPPHDPAAVDVPDFLPDTPKVRADLALYYDEIGRFDLECGQILDLLDRNGLTENTLIVMAGDNGMPFPRAKATLYEAGVNVPLLARWPGHIKPGQSTEALASLMDLSATWLEAAGVTPPERMESRSLLPVLTGASPRHRELVFAERNWHDNWDPARCAIGTRYKLIQNYRPELGHLQSLDLLRSPSSQSIRALASEGKLKEPLTWHLNTSKPHAELYDLENDPGEWKNLAGDPAHHDTLVALQKALGAWMNETNDFLPPPAAAYGNGNRQDDTLDGGARWWDKL